MNTQLNSNSLIIGILLVVGTAAGDLAAQQFTSKREQDFIDSSGGMPWISLILVAGVLFTAAFLLWRRKNGTKSNSPNSFENRIQAKRPSSNVHEIGVDAEKELEWFRKVKKPATKIEVRTESERRHSKRRISEITGSTNGDQTPDISSKQFQDRMKKLQYAQLPINSFVQLTDARSFDNLQLSADPALLSAIEQVNEEFEEDEAVRELAVKILAAFRTKNSIESLSQIALYDLSANLRSKAVSILTDFDHESVFEAIVLACADPTREVRATAARGLFRLSFDRAEAWKRIIATHDEFRMTHAVRAAVESGIVLKSFDRLIHEDMRIAYEAFALVGLLIKCGETDAVFDSIQNHQDERVRFALLHVLKVVKDERALTRLETMLRENVLPIEISKRTVETIKDLELIGA